MTTGEPTKTELLLQEARDQILDRLNDMDIDRVSSIVTRLVAALGPQADPDTSPTGRNRWEFYQDEKKKYRWRCKDVNGEILFASTQGYFTSGSAKDCAARAGWCNGNGTTTGLY